MFRLHLLCFSRGAQISTKDTEIPHWALLYTHVKETELKYLHFSNVLQLHLSGSTWRQSKKMRPSSDSHSEKKFATQHTEVRQRPVAINCFSRNKAQQNQRYNRDSHYKNSVYWFNKFTSQLLWMTGVIPHMEGTLGEAVFWYLFTILWKDVQSVNFQIITEQINCRLRNKYIVYYFSVGSRTLTNFNIYK